MNIREYTKLGAELVALDELIAGMTQGAYRHCEEGSAYEGWYNEAYARNAGDSEGKLKERREGVIKARLLY